MAPEYLHRLYLLLNKLCISLLNYTNDMNGCIIDEETKWPHFNLLYQRVPSIAILGVIFVIAILGVILVLLLREQITTFWRVYHLCTYKRCRKNAISCFLSHFFAIQYQKSCENFAFILAPKHQNHSQNRDHKNRDRWYTLVCNCILHPASKLMYLSTKVLTEILTQECDK